MCEGTRPRVAVWFESIKARPAFKPALIDWCPPDLTNDYYTLGGRTGRASSDSCRSIECRLLALSDMLRRRTTLVAFGVERTLTGAGT